LIERKVKWRFTIGAPHFVLKFSCGVVSIALHFRAAKPARAGCRADEKGFASGESRIFRISGNETNSLTPSRLEHVDISSERDLNRGGAVFHRPPDAACGERLIRKG
jgi:hypothetical protein